MPIVQSKAFECEAHVGQFLRQGARPHIYSVRRTKSRYCTFRGVLSARELQSTQAPHRRQRKSQEGNVTACHSLAIANVSIVLEYQWHGGPYCLLNKSAPRSQTMLAATTKQAARLTPVPGPFVGSILIGTMLQNVERYVDSKGTPPPLSVTKTNRQRLSPEASRDCEKRQNRRRQRGPS